MIILYGKAFIECSENYMVQNFTLNFGITVVVSEVSLSSVCQYIFFYISIAYLNRYKFI